MFVYQILVKPKTNTDIRKLPFQSKKFYSKQYYLLLLTYVIEFIDNGWPSGVGSEYQLLKLSLNLSRLKPMANTYTQNSEFFCVTSVPSFLSLIIKI